MSAAAEGFELTPAQEAYYAKHRDKFEDVLSQAVCEAITADEPEVDPIEAVIRALRHRRQTPSGWTTARVQSILSHARMQSRPVQRSEWSMDRWLQQLKVHEIIGTILTGAAKERVSAAEPEEHAEGKSTSESDGFSYVTALHQLQGDVKTVGVRTL